MKLVAYCRTSTANGAGQDSLGAQADACAGWAAAYGHEIVEVERDDGLSGSLGPEGRPGLQRALLALEQGETEGLIVHRLDRLARELHVQEAALAHAWGAGEHVRIFEAVEGEIPRDDPSDPHRRFLRQVMGAAVELERGLIRARLAGGRRRKAAAGGYIGGDRLHRRFGYELVDGQYVPVEAEQTVILRIASLRSEGASWGAVADALNAEGVEPPSGVAWYPMTALRIAQREQALGG